jgi:tetratricopeptide (TPR) repeat protein
MKFASLKPLTRRPSVVIASLSIIALLAFFFVSRLVHRFGEEEKALARRMFAQGQLEQRDGQPKQAIEDFRVALSYDRENFPYQLNLARALRDNNQPEEARTYLLNLWDRTPDDGPVNLALARLAAREGRVEDAVHYYHNAAYGRWGAEADNKRRNAQFELVDFLLSQDAFPQAQAELLNLSATLPADENLRLHLGQLFAGAQDYEHALSEYRLALLHHRNNPAALAGAGEAAFHLGRYRAAEDYLSGASSAGATDDQVTQMGGIARLVLQSDPYERGLSDRQRERRTRAAFYQAGMRLDDCAAAVGGDNLPSSSSSVPPSRPVAPVPLSPEAAAELRRLKESWIGIKAKLIHSRALPESETSDAAMDTVFQIEQATRKQCGKGSGVDEALRLLAENRSEVER